MASQLVDFIQLMWTKQEVTHVTTGRVTHGMLVHVPHGPIIQWHMAGYDTNRWHEYWCGRHMGESSFNTWLEKSVNEVVTRGPYMGCHMAPKDWSLVFFVKVCWSSWGSNSGPPTRLRLPRAGLSNPPCVFLIIPRGEYCIYVALCLLHTGVWAGA